MTQGRRVAMRESQNIEWKRSWQDTCLKRAAVLLFGRDPERLITGAYVKIGFFETDADLMYHDEIHGNLFLQVDRTLDLLFTKHLKADISYERVQRVETWPIPEKALREAVINAVAHKDYAAGWPIQISVYEDKLLLWNPGVLPGGWTLEQLSAKHASHPFNPDIASVFFKAAYLESWGRGFELIDQECKAHGCPPPQLRWDNGLWVEFAFDPEKTRGKTDQAILALVSEEPRISRDEMAETLGLTVKGVEWQLRKLQASGRLRRVGPAKGGSWELLP